MKQAVLTHAKSGFVRLDGITDRRRWLFCSLETSGLGSGTSSVNPITGQVTTTGIGVGIPSGSPTSSTATVQTGTYPGIPQSGTYTLTLSNEYTDDAVYADTIALLNGVPGSPPNNTTPGIVWNSLLINRQAFLNYDGNGNIAVTEGSTQFGPIICNETINQIGTTNIFSTGLQVEATRFYSFSPSICVLTSYGQNGIVSPPAATCAIQAPTGLDPVYGPYFQIGPMNIQTPPNDYVNWFSISFGFTNPSNTVTIPAWPCDCINMSP